MIRAAISTAGQQPGGARMSPPVIYSEIAWLPFGGGSKSGPFARVISRLALFGQRRESNRMTLQPPSSFPGQIPAAQVAFHRTELSVIMSLYGRMVAAGEWRDYGISCLREIAVFSIFRRTAEHPLYRIEKEPKLRNKQGQYSVVAMDGKILKRGHDLKAVLRVLERKLIRVVD